MGLFGRNWEKQLDRAEELLGRELPIPALEIAERAARKAGPELRGRAEALVERARGAALAAVLANADAAEAAGDVEDAADWLLSAVEQEPDSGRRAAHEARRQALLERSRSADGFRPVERHTIDVVASETETEVDLPFRYDTLVSMLHDEVRGRYEDRPPEFQRALVELNEGDAAAALPALERLAAKAPEDPILRLELGRARRLAGDPEGAVADLEAAWRALGDGPLDVSESLLVPALWAEAALAAGDAEAVIDRLAPVTESTAHPELDKLLAAALLTADRPDEALAHLQTALPHAPGDAELNLLAARALAATGDPERARAVLEQAVAPSCATGGCARPAPHLPSFRFLAQLHLEPGGDPERARELIARIADARQGRLEREDLLILAAYYRATGDPVAAEDATAEARRLTDAGETAAEVQGPLAAQSDRIL